MSSGRDEYLSKFDSTNATENFYYDKRYADFNEWFKLALPSLWIQRDEPWTNVKLKLWLEDAFNSAREVIHCKGPQRPD